jgi:hypothetical protein
VDFEEIETGWIAEDMEINQGDEIWLLMMNYKGVVLHGKEEILLFNTNMPIYCVLFSFQYCAGGMPQNNCLVTVVYKIMEDIPHFS